MPNPVLDSVATTAARAAAASIAPSKTSVLVLASTSRYRQELLSRLCLPFEAVAPMVDETPLPGEAPLALALRLARAKALAVAALRPEAAVVGSDQVCDLEGQALGKPGTHEKAVKQLLQLSGRTAVFQTAVCVAHAASGYEKTFCVPVHVKFRTLQLHEIEAYLQLEPAYDCAGSAKSEGLGIALLEAMPCEDPTALVGLPLIRTAALLREVGLDPLRRAAR